MSNFYQLSFFDINKETRKFLIDNSSDYFESMFMFFIYKNLRSISKDSSLLGILKDFPDLRLSLGFTSIPNPSQVSRFKFHSWSKS